MVNVEETEAWLIDLDNTLYPAECDLFAQIDVKMGAFIAELLSVDRTEARRIQKDYYFKYGTTLAGLMRVHNINPDDFLDFVHDIDVSVIEPDPGLVALIEALPGRKIIFTNGSHQHAVNIVGHMGLDSHFDEIFDIKAGDYVPKPDPAPYAKLIEQAGVDPKRSVMVDDIAHNLEPAFDLGMSTVWVRLEKDWSRRGLAEGENAPSYVSHTVGDLKSFLQQIIAAAEGSG